MLYGRNPSNAGKHGKRLWVKAVTEPDSAESTKLDRIYGIQWKFTIFCTGIQLCYRIDLVVGRLTLGDENEAGREGRVSFSLENLTLFFFKQKSPSFRIV